VTYNKEFYIVVTREFLKIKFFFYNLAIITSIMMIIMINNNMIFLIGTVGGGAQLGPHGPAATIRPIVPAPGDYDDGEIDGMMIDRGNRSTRRKPAPVLLCPPQTPHALPGGEPGPPPWEASD
jgi:hypothetical protein